MKKMQLLSDNPAAFGQTKTGGVFMKRRNEWTNERPCEILDPSHTDPQGMYTGVPENPWEKPVQDADDL